VLTESQVQALESAREEKQAHGEIETHHPGFLLGQDTYYVGYIKGIGKIYQQTGIDTFSNVGFAKLYSDRTGLTAADFQNDKVLPFFDGHSIRVLRTLTDRGREYCGRTENHPYQLYLHLAEIEHSRTKARHPQTNGATERLNQIVGEEFYQVAFRKTLYTSLEQLQGDLDAYMRRYNEERTNQGKRCQGRTPMETFLAGLDLYQQYVYESAASESVMPT
jgi:transposase InsO family protein